MLELDTLLDRLPKELSGGQRQRVSMGRAIVRNPSVFLFDEPLSNLDAKLRVKVRGEISDLHRRLKTTSVYVTHDQIEAMTLGQKIVYGVRPEHIDLVAGSQDTGIPAVIHSVENTGSDMVVLCDADGFRMTSAFKEQRNLGIGQHVTLVPDAGKVRIFDAATEKRVWPTVTD